MCQRDSTWNNLYSWHVGKLSACVNSGYLAMYASEWNVHVQTCSGYLGITRGSMPPDSHTVNKCRAVMLFTPANNFALPR